jgi:hypothetical protein
MLKDAQYERSRKRTRTLYYQSAARYYVDRQNILKITQFVFLKIKGFYLLSKIDGRLRYSSSLGLELFRIWRQKHFALHFLVRFQCAQIIFKGKYAEHWHF